MNIKKILSSALVAVMLFTSIVAAIPVASSAAYSSSAVSGETVLGIEAENLMRGRLTAAHIVVIHTREIIVDQRKRVHHFDRSREGHRRFKRSAANATKLIDEKGSYSFSTRGNAV